MGNENEEVMANEAVASNIDHDGNVVGWAEELGFERGEYVTMPEAWHAIDAMMGEVVR